LSSGSFDKYCNWALLLISHSGVFDLIFAECYYTKGLLHVSLLPANHPQTEREPQSHIKHFAQITLYIFLNQIPLTQITDT